MSHTVTHHPAGELPDTVAPGDIGVVSDPKAPDSLSQLIQAGGRAIAGHTAWANLIHSFGVTTSAGDIVEANAPGVQRNRLEGYRHQDFYIVHVDATPEQRALCVARWESCVGMEYDVVGFVGLALKTLFNWKVLINDDHGLICSALVCFGALAYVTTFSRPYQEMMPTNIAIEFNFPIPEPPMPLGFFARFLDALAAVGKAISPFGK